MNDIIWFDYPPQFPVKMSPEDEEKMERLYQEMKKLLTNLRTSSKVTASEHDTE